MTPEFQLLEERIAHLKEIGDLRDRLQEKALALASAESRNRINVVLSILAVIATVVAAKLVK